jgi:hypothetical protein
VTKKLIPINIGQQIVNHNILKPINFFTYFFCVNILTKKLKPQILGPKKVRPKTLMTNKIPSHTSAGKYFIEKSNHNISWA